KISHKFPDQMSFIICDEATQKGIDRFCNNINEHPLDLGKRFEAISKLKMHGWIKNPLIVNTEYDDKTCQMS
ncbi:hypothetical protein NPIL_15921, partial [Nephila pilipes]